MRKTNLCMPVLFAAIIALHGCINKDNDSDDNGATNLNPGGPIIPQLLNDTGMLTCSNETSVVPCPASGYPGQDADVGLDVEENDNSNGFAGFNFTKLDANGSVLPASATSWSCVQDENTGLVWEVKQPLPGELHSAGNTYTWYSTDSTRNSGDPGTMDGGTCNGSNCDTESFVAAVNTEGLCGFTDWRMPERDEINSIVRMVSSTIDAPVDTDYFPYHGTAHYWSGTSPGYSAMIGISGGSANYLARFSYGFLPKANQMRVRLVRGHRWIFEGDVTAQFDQTCQTDTVPASTPTSRFTDNNDGTVTDKLTRLTWTRCPLGKSWDSVTNFCTGAATSYTWQAALQEVANLNTSGTQNGFSDWRLPNYKEIISITEVQCVSPAINLEVFPIWNADSIYVFWTSTAGPTNPAVAMRMGFNDGWLSSLRKTLSQNVLMVRDAD